MDVTLAVRNRRFMATSCFARPAFESCLRMPVQPASRFKAALCYAPDTLQFLLIFRHLNGAMIEIIRPVGRSENAKLLFLFDNYALDTDRRELHHGGAAVAVEPQVFD